MSKTITIQYLDTPENISSLNKIKEAYENQIPNLRILKLEEKIKSCGFPYLMGLYSKNILERSFSNESSFEIKPEENDLGKILCLKFKLRLKDISFNRFYCITFSEQDKNNMFTISYEINDETYIYETKNSCLTLEKVLDKILTKLLFRYGCTMEIEDLRKWFFE